MTPVDGIDMLELSTLMLCGLPEALPELEGDTILPDDAPVLMLILCCPVGEEGVEEGESKDEQGR